MKLDTYLSERNIKPSAFAAEIGVAASTITRVLKGERSPGFDLVMKIQHGTRGKVKPSDWYASDAKGVDEGHAA